MIIIYGISLVHRLHIQNTDWPVLGAASAMKEKAKTH